MDIAGASMGFLPRARLPSRTRLCWRHLPRRGLAQRTFHPWIRSFHRYRRLFAGVSLMLALQCFIVQLGGYGLRFSGTLRLPEPAPRLLEHLDAILPLSAEALVLPHLAADVDPGANMTALRAPREEEAQTEASPRSANQSIPWPLPVSADGMLELPLVELAVDDAAHRVTKVFVPLLPEVAAWWTRIPPAQFSYRMDTTPDPNGGARKGRLVVEAVTAGGDDRLHLPWSLVPAPPEKGEEPALPPVEMAEGDGVVMKGVRSLVALPDDVVVEDCQVATLRVIASFRPLSDLGPIRAVLVRCPAQASQGRVGRTNMLAAARSALFDKSQYRSPLRWFLLPWLVLLMPFLLGSTLGPAALVGGTCLTLVSFASLSFIMATFLVVGHRRCLTSTRRWRRIWRFWSLCRKSAQVDDAFGKNGPCCICLGDPSPGEPIIALLPCRHALHCGCYDDWVRADSYPAQDLICPLCRCRTEAIANLR
eukprot:TRINITY_DN36118_c0_g1_i1.p1 TRINITY_DN36118_c0_g1~~TRINITY_DN36118_c0_g1_i1.p1  ORF type:complete len:479 (+),score=5.01 TRINITY_DN36118_c0_g1_i1:112-1548(+)